jgi:DNA-binding transcriptional ArsR family regulator
MSNQRASTSAFSVDAAFDALGDPMRRRIVERLRPGPLPVGELAAALPIGRPAVSKHLKVLEGAGLITRGRTAQLRPSHLEGASLKEAADWIEGYRSFWERGFERMERRLGGRDG